MHRAILGVQELADLFGVSKQTFGMRLKQGYWCDFPEPLYKPAAGRFWSWEQLAAFTSKQGRWMTWNQSREMQTARGRLEAYGQLTIDDIKGAGQ